MFPADGLTMPSTPLYKKKTATFSMELAGDSEAAGALVVGWSYQHAGCIGRMDRND